MNRKPTISFIKGYVSFIQIESRLKPARFSIHGKPDWQGKNGNFFFILHLFTDPATHQIIINESHQKPAICQPTGVISGEKIRVNPHNLSDYWRISGEKNLRKSA